MQAPALLALVAGQDVEPAEGSDGTDGKYPALFDAILADAGIKVVQPGVRMPT